MEKRLNNFYYVNSFLFSPFNKGFWDSFQNQQISNNFIKNKAKEQKVIMKLLNFKRLYYRNYLTLKDLDQDQKDPVFEYLKKLVPSVFQDGVLNFQLLKEHLEPNQIIKENNNFGLYWNGKNFAKANALLDLKSKTLIPCKNKSLNFDQSENIIIEGDNLEALKILEKSYFNQVDVIYIDQPYNTGNDFVYHDDFKQSVEEYQNENNLVNDEGLKTTTNQKTSGRFHTNWLNMIYPRLMIAKNLLKDSGVIFISIDDNELARLKLICDEIFGEENFQNIICWVSNKKGRQITGNIFSKTKEYILVYSKSSFNWNNLYSREYLFKIMPSIYEPKEIEIYKDEISEYIIQNELHNTNPKLFNSKTRPNLFFSIYVNDEEISLTKKDGFDEVYPPYNNETNIQSVWRWSKDKVQKESFNLVWKKVNGKYKIFTKKREISFQGKDLILSSSITTKSGGDELKKLNINTFDFPKPTSLIKFLISNLNKNGLVLDFFAGSGTTAQAVMELNQEDGGNRKYVLVQLPEPIENNPEFKTIADVTRTRIVRSIEKYQYNDLGFKYFKVGPTNFPIWQVSNHDDEQAIAKQLDLFSETPQEQNYEAMLYELMLTAGMRLDWKIESKTINQHQFWIDEYKDYCFFLKPQNPDEVLNIIKNVLNEKSNNSETEVYINENYFQTDQEKINFAEQLKQLGKQIKLVVV